MTSSTRNASGSGQGYLYQFLLTLKLTLEKSRGTEDFDVNIENYDDISFLEDSEPKELIQSKHTAKPKNLTDGSEDLWKTIAIWIDIEKKSNVKKEFFLVTNSTASKGSAAFYLSTGFDRDSEKATEILSSKASTLKADATKSYRELYLSQKPKFIKALFSRVNVVDGQPGISDIEDAISKNFLFTILDQHKTPLMERFLGWWLKEIVTLLKDTTKSINNKFVTQKLQDLAYQFHNESLPIDFISEEPDWKNNWESKVFVKQVRLITERDGRIKNAIRDYYRAFEQRSRWAREELLVDDELEKYEQKLVEEWHRFKERTLDEMNPKSDDDERVVGNKIFNWVEGTANFPIRKKVTEEYITRGSYHILADNLKVGWHPKFVERLKELLENE